MELILAYFFAAAAMYFAYRNVQAELRTLKAQELVTALAQVILTSQKDTNNG